MRRPRDPQDSCSNLSMLLESTSTSRLKKVKKVMLCPCRLRLVGLIYSQSKCSLSWNHVTVNWQGSYEPFRCSVKWWGVLPLGRPVFAGQLCPISLLPSSCAGASVNSASVSDMNTGPFPSAWRCDRMKIGINFVQNLCFFKLRADEFDE